MKKIISIFILTVCLISSTQAFEKVGSTSFQFLKVMTTARATAMGEAYSAVTRHSDAVFFNPAGLMNVQSLDVSIDYLDWFLDIKHYAAAAAYTVPGIGTFALQAIVTDVGQIRETTVDALGFVDGVYLGYTGVVFEPGATVLGISYARGLTDKFSFGLTAKYAEEDLGLESTGNIMFDGGLTYDTGFRSLKLSAVIRNFGGDVSFLDEVDHARKTADDSVYYVKYTGKSYPLPQTFNIGVAAYLIGPGENLFMQTEGQTLLFAFDLVQPRDYDQQYHLGFEYGFKNILFLRGGYKLNYDQESYSLGFGINYSDFRIDYSYSDFGDYLDSVHRFSFGFALN